MLKNQRFNNGYSKPYIQITAKIFYASSDFTIKDTQVHPAQKVVRLGAEVIHNKSTEPVNAVLVTFSKIRKFLDDYAAQELRINPDSAIEGGVDKNGKIPIMTAYDGNKTIKVEFEPPLSVEEDWSSITMQANTQIKTSPY